MGCLNGGFGTGKQPTKKGKKGTTEEKERVKRQRGEESRAENKKFRKRSQHQEREWEQERDNGLLSLVEHSLQ